MENANASILGFGRRTLPQLCASCCDETVSWESATFGNLRKQDIQLVMVSSTPTNDLHDIT